MRLHRLKAWWAVRRRLRELRRGLLTSVVDPQRAAEVAARLEVPPGLWEHWLRGLKPIAQPAASRLEVVTKPSEEEWEEVRRAKKPSAGLRHRPRIASDSQAVSERARRQLLLLLDLPMMRREPELATEVIVHLAEAVATGDQERLAALGGAIEDGYWICATGRPSVLRAPTGLSEPPNKPGDQPECLQASDESAEHATKTSVGGVPVLASRLQIVDLSPTDIVGVEDSAVPELATHFDEISTVRRWERTRSLELPALPEGPEWACVGKLLETLCGDPEARDSLSTELAFLDSLKERLRENPGPPASSISLVAVVHQRLERLVMELADRSTLDRGQIDAALDVAAQHLTSSLEELSWAWEPRLRGGGRSHGGRPFPDHVDVAWTLLRRVALSAMLFRRDGRLSKQTPPQIRRLDLVRSADYGRLESALTGTNAQDVQRGILFKLRALGQTLYRSLLFDAASFVETLVEVWHLTREPLEVIPSPQQPEEADQAPPTTGPVDLGTLLRPLLTSDWARTDPELAVRLAGEISRRGTLSWQTCLELANSRMGFHRYVETPPHTKWQMMAEVRPGGDGGLEIPFSVVEQPLSPRFRGLFESQHLEGRVRILRQLVAYAARLRGAILRIGTADVAHQVALREGELWQELLAIDPSLNSELGAT